MPRACTAALLLLATALSAGCAARPARTAPVTARGDARPTAAAFTPNTLLTMAVSGFALMAGLHPLRDTVLAPGDLEARLWRATSAQEVYLLRRTAGRWSGSWVRPRAVRPAIDSGRPRDAYESRPLPDTAVARTWAALEAGGLLTLRDAPGRLPTRASAESGESYVFEVRRGTRYQAEGFSSVDAFPGPAATAARALFATAQTSSAPPPR